MSYLSYRQIIYRDYLIKKLGFIEDDFLDPYLELLEIVSPRFRMLGRQKKIWNEEGRHFVPENNNKFNEYIDKGDFYIPEKFNIIDLLRIEVLMKRNRTYKFKDLSLRYISATDISNYTYCPVSYAISKTFELEKLESTVVGTSQHEQQRLINYIKPFKYVEKDIEFEKILSFDNYITENNIAFFNELKESKTLFDGHNASSVEKKYFKSKKGEFIGQPDYIFQNNNSSQIFVVEEKFQFVPQDPKTFDSHNYAEAEVTKIHKKRNSKIFYSNHINQVNSYIYGINEYDINHGYLIYWKYEMNDLPKIISCNVLKLERNENQKASLIDTYIKLKSLISNKGGDFDIKKRVPARCAGCVNNILCGHKSGKFSNFSIPYSNDYLKLYYAVFPAELKKDVKNENSTDSDNNK